MSKIDIFNVTDINMRGHRHLEGFLDPDNAPVALLQEDDGTTLLSSANGCANCGLYGSDNYTLTEDGQCVSLTECPLPDGLIYTTRLNIPSGKVIFTDNMFRGVWEEIPMPEEVSYNTVAGQRLYTEAAEKAGMAFGYAGDSSPGIYRDPATGDLQVISEAFVEFEDGEVDENGDEGYHVPPAGLEKVGQVFTEMWAVSAVDYADYLARGGKKPGKHDNFVVVDVEPGVWEFTIHTGNADFQPWGGDEALVMTATKVA